MKKYTFKFLDKDNNIIQAFVVYAYDDADAFKAYDDYTKQVYGGDEYLQTEFVSCITPLANKD